MKLKVALIGLFVVLSPLVGKTEQFFIQDSTSYPDQLIKELRNKLFPSENNAIFPQPGQYCFEYKPVFLVQRTIQTPVDTIVEYIRKVFFLKDTALIPELTNLYYNYLEYFQAEWGWAILKTLYCEELTKQLEIIEAFETAIYGLKIRDRYASHEDYYNFIRDYCDALTLPRSYDLLHYKTDTINIIQSIGAEPFYTIINYNISSIDSMRILSASRRHSEYTQRLHQYHNSFGGVLINFSIFSPYLEEIKPFILKDYTSYKNSRFEKTFRNYMDRQFFELRLRPGDYKILDIPPIKP